MAVRNTSIFSNFSQRDYPSIVIQRIRNLRYDVRIHIHIHTDTARVQHVNVGLAQARPNYEDRAHALGRSIARHAASVTRGAMTEVEACMACATTDHERQAAHRQYKFRSWWLRSLQVRTMHNGIYKRQKLST